MTGHNAVRGADLIVDTLIRLGARHAFNVIGLGMYDLGDAFHARRDAIAYISHVNETNLALVAQGYARATRKPTFCFVYYASGTGLAMASLTSAWADRAPLVLVSTTGSRLTSGRDQYAAVPRSILEMGAQFAKWSYEVPTPERLPEALARAYAIAAEPPMGPVHLAIPSDLFGALVTGEPPRADFERTRTFVEDRADDAGLIEAARLLAQAKTPILMAGSEVGQLGAAADLARLAEALGAPVLIENMPSYLSMPTTHPHHAGMFKANAALRAEADVALAIGVEFTEIGMAGEPQQLGPGTTLIALSVDRALPVRQRWPDLAISGHPRPSLARLAELIEAEPPPAAVRDSNLARCRQVRARRSAERDRIAALDRTVSPVPPGLIVDTIRDLCGQDWIFMNSGTTAGDDFDVVWELDDPDDFHALSGKGSCQGWGAPVAIGVQLARPDRRVMALVGDGNLMFTGTSLWAAARYKLPIIFVIANNGGWAHVLGTIEGLTGEEAAEMSWTFEEAPVDYVGFARSLGLSAERAATADELAAMLRRAAAQDGPWLIEVPTARVAGGPPLVRRRAAA